MRVFFLLVAGTALAAPSVQRVHGPLSFEPNTGQASASVRYLARGSSYTLYLAGDEIVLAGRNQAPLRTRLSGAEPLLRITGEGLQDSTSNYFIGNDPALWRTSVPNFARVRYGGVYAGIDLVFYEKDGSLEYDWIVSPGADPRKIRMTFESVEELRIDRQGDLVIQKGGNEYRHKKPAIYQLVAGKRVAVDGRWTLHGNEAGFRLGAYDRSKELVIDPPLIYSTYYGGTGLDYAYAVAVDSIGNTYVAGGVGSANLNILGQEDGFVTKLRPNGSKIYTTFLGGNGTDEARGVAVDLQGNAYVTGTTGSLDFPTKGPIQAKTGGTGDVFVAKLNASGAVVYATYLGGSGIDTASGIAIDTAGNAYVVGSTFSTDFPMKNPFQGTKGAQEDAFITKVNATGTAWVYSTYLGGNNVDEGNGIAVDAAGNAYVTGYTASTNFPLQSPFQSSNPAASVDAFVTKINPAGSALVYSTYLGGSALDYGTAIAVDASGSAYVTGIVTSDDFPVANAIDKTLGSHAVDDAFVTKFNPTGSGLVYSTYLGGGSTDDPYAVAVDQAGNVWVTGRTNSSDFPLTNALQTTRTAFDMFVTEINAAGTAQVFSTFIGGSGSESGRGIAVDRLGNIHIAGEGTSTDFPVKNATQGANGGGSVTQDALVLLLGDTVPSNGPAVTAVSDNLTDGGPVTPGGWFYVKGTELAETTRIWGGSDFSEPVALPTDLNGVEVWVNGAPVPVYFISPGQVNAQAPSNISGTMTVQVVRLGLASNTLTAPVAPIQPSLYFYQAGQKSYAAALFADYSIMGDPAVAPGTRKAKVGDIIQLYASGLGPAQSGSAITSPVPVTGIGVTIGTTAASVQFAGLVAPGQYQVNFTVPQLPAGEYSIQVSVAGKTSQANILFEIGQ